MQVHWNKLEWVNQKRRNRRINNFCTSSFGFYIKDEDMLCYWVVHSKIKPNNVDELFKIKS